MMRYTAIIICILFAVLSLPAQRIATKSATLPKQEMRAVWIASVLNIDYPRTPSTNPIALKEQYKLLLDQLEDLGINTVIVQVRPAGDALYPSQYAPWSAYLTGQQGRSPQDDFDPLAFMIEESHRRAIEFHAWINPFRAAMNLDTSSLFLTHPVFKHPNWLVKYGKKMYFNPGLPDVRDHLVDVVGELVDNYDLDGLHIDDYFYPYPEGGLPFPDSLTYRFYGRQTHPDINTWRRSNTDDLVQRLYTRIKESKPHVQFGVSPFGVWRNKDKDPRGSDTRAGVTSYDNIFADVLHWVDRGWIDYVIPQLYWNIGYEPADHAKLVQWWSQHVHDVPLYIGHAAYKVGNNAEKAWHDPAEIGRQIDLNRRNFETRGSAFFSAKSLLADPLQLKDSLRFHYRTAALWPERPELELPKLQPVNIRRPRWRDDAVRLRWKPNRDGRSAGRKPHYYVIYRFPGNTPLNFDDPSYIYDITAFQPQDELPRKIDYYDENTQPGAVYSYAVTAVSRANQESKPAASDKMERKENRIRKARVKRARNE